MPGPSTLLHGFAEVLEARSMCLKLAVVILASCVVWNLAANGDVLVMWREKFGVRRGNDDALVGIY
jgi:hypothetical protein